MKHAMMTNGSGVFSSPLSRRRRRPAPRFTALAAVLAVMVLGGAPAVAQPTLTLTEVDALPGTLVRIAASDAFDDAGTKARFTEAVFSTTEYYYDNSGIMDEAPEFLFVMAKTAEHLNDMDSPPDSPFTVTATVTMTNDEKQTASGTITFTTTYAKASGPSQPSLTRTDVDAPPGTLVRIAASDAFDDAGTNARFTEVVFSTMEYYYDSSGIMEQAPEFLFVMAKTAEDLKDMDSPPDSPFVVTARVTMTNDEEQTATGTIALETTYAKATPSQPDTPQPTAKTGVRRTVDPGNLVSVTAGEVFDNAGTNPKLTAAEFSTTSYYQVGETGIQSGRLFVRAKTAAQLNAMAARPDSPFTVTATVTMTNDEGATVEGTVEFVTTYHVTPT